MHTSQPPWDIALGPDKPVYLQIADHLRTQLALGKLAPGDRLPAIREVAQKLEIDPGTVARAYRELARDGAITGRTGHGSFVAGGQAQRQAAERQRARLAAIIEQALIEGLGLGATIEDIETAFTLQLARWRERRSQPPSMTAVVEPRPGQRIRFHGSHDMAIELLASHLGTLYPHLRLETTFVGSLAGLMALECGQADIAGAHLMDQESGEFNVAFIKRLLPGETVVLMNLMHRLQGLIVPHGNPRHILGIEDLARRGITFVNRQKGSGTRIMLDSRLFKAGISSSQIRGYDREEKTHLAVASVVAQGQADVGLGAQSAASVAGLDFIPLFKERYDLVARDFSQPPFDKLAEVVRGESFRNMIAAIPGYDVIQTGHMITVGAA